MTSALWLVALVACGDDAMRDAGAPDAAVAIAAPPEPPVAPDFGACLPGYHGGGAAPCMPYDEGGRRECPDGQTHFPGEPDCATVGAACTGDGWPADLPASTRYVRPGATGSGSRESPFGSIAEAISFARSGDTIALSEGVHEGRLSLGRHVTIRGACAERTTVHTGDPTAPVIVAAGADLTLRDLRLTGGTVAIVAGRDSRLDLDGVIVEDTGGGVYLTDGASADMRSVWMRRIVRRVATEGAGVYSDVDVVSTIERAVIESCAAISVVGVRDSDITLSRVDLRGAPGDTSTGVEVEAGRLVASGLSADYVRGATVLAREGADITLEDVSIEHPADLPIATGTLVRRAIAAQSGSTVRVARMFGTGLAEVAAIATDEGSVLELADVILVPEDGERHGRGIAAQNGGRADIERVVIEHAGGIGLAVLNGGAIDARDLAIRDIAIGELDGVAYGIALQSGATGTFERVAIDRALGGGVVVIAASMDASDLRVSDTAPQPIGGNGHGIVGQFAQITLARTRVERTYEAGVMIIGAGATLAATDLGIFDSVPNACGEPSCAGGIALVAADHASATAERFELTRSSLCSVLLALDAQLDLRHGVLEESPNGVCLQVEGYDVTRLQDDVVLTAIGAAFDSTDLPIPRPLAPIE